jgi:hypothetical protein
MGFFANLFGSKVDDPILGRLEYREGTWRGQIEWPNNAQPAGLFYTSETKPDATLRERVESIKQSAKKLERELQQAFFDVWKSSGKSLPARRDAARLVPIIADGRPESRRLPASTADIWLSRCGFIRCVF